MAVAQCSLSGSSSSVYTTYRPCGQQPARAGRGQLSCSTVVGCAERTNPGCCTRLALQTGAAGGPYSTPMSTAYSCCSSSSWCVRCGWVTGGLPVGSSQPGLTAAQQSWHCTKGVGGGGGVLACVRWLYRHACVLAVTGGVVCICKANRLPAVLVAGRGRWVGVSPSHKAHRLASCRSKQETDMHLWVM